MKKYFLILAFIFIITPINAKAITLTDKETIEVCTLFKDTIVDNYGTKKTIKILENMSQKEFWNFTYKFQKLGYFINVGKNSHINIKTLNKCYYFYQNKTKNNIFRNKVYER